MVGDRDRHARVWPLPAGSPPGRPAFSLVELLVVIGIIALLLAILLPTLSRVRNSAKATRTAALLAAIEKGLNAFQADFREYPDSACPMGRYRRPDPIVSWPAVGSLPAPRDLRENSSEPLTGAHWLARAMAGHDLRGIDTNARTMGQIIDPASQNWNIQRQSYYITYEKLRDTERRPPYLEGEVFVRDDDPVFFRLAQSTVSDYTPRGRLIIRDESFGSPVLYYRANTRAQNPFCRTGFGDDRMGSQSGDMAGIYCHQDNSYITGDDQSQQNRKRGWDFTGTGKSHAIARFGIAVGDVTRITDPDSFVNFLRNPAGVGLARDASGNAISLTPHNPGTFILLAAGPDGLYGTGDDIGNFPVRKN